MAFITEEIVLDAERGVTLSVHLLPTGGWYPGITARPAVLILPGGGYNKPSAREAENVAASYLAAGYHAMVLRYRAGAHRAWPGPLEDYEAAMTLIGQRAQEWCLRADRIAVIGFSAGGHLAACAATIAQHRPAAAVLIYPLLAGPTLQLCMPGDEVPLPVEHVDAATAPVFHAQSRDDTVTPIVDALDFLGALARAGVTFESHTYAYGEHGFSTAVPSVHPAAVVTGRSHHWVADSISWLAEVLGALTTQGMGRPSVGPRANADYEEMLSLDCTVGHLLSQQGQARQVLAPALEALDAMEIEAVQRSGLVAPGVDEDTARSAFRRLAEPARLRSVLQLIGASSEEMASLEEWLITIPNTVPATACEAEGGADSVRAGG